jgi:hypothetical protein
VLPFVAGELRDEDARFADADRVEALLQRLTATKELVTYVAQAA